MNISGENLGKIKPSSKSEGNTSFLRAARNGQLEKVLEHLKSNIDINTSNANGLNALHLASKDGHVEIVEELLKRGAVVDAATKKGNTALHIASLAGQEEVVKLLVQHGASVNVQSQNGFTPLYMAAQENHDNVVKYLLGHGANQSLSTEDGFTPLAVAMQQGHDKVVTVLLENDTRGKVRLPALHIAAKKDDVKAAKLLLENDHNPDVTSKSGFTPLHIASHYGNQSIANLLIQKGADVNYAAKHNITPLHVAAKWGKSNMVALLLDQGANIEAKTRDGLTPLHCAARSGHEQVVDMLLEKGAPISSKTKNGLAPLHMAAQGDHVDAARILLYHRAPVDEVTVDYLTALHVAAHCGHVRVAKLLLDRQADANARALNGFTPLHIACKKNRIKVVELLLKHGASIGATTESGLTPLHVASFMGCMNIVIYLLQHDASPDAPTVRGETPLHLAARANQTDIIRILLRNGAQVDARAREQQTPLHIASRLGNVDIVMLLLQHGAKVDNTTKDMYTALHIAAKEGQDEVAAVLIDNGASLNATTKKGFTPLHLASKYGHLKVAKLLLQKEAPVDAQGKNGVTPLHVASHYDHQNVALLLLNKGASPHAMAKNGHTPLHIAARKNQMDIADTLLEYGAQPNAESKAGFTPLHLSAQEGHSDISSLLIEHKANPNHQAKNGLTPLHLCAQEDRVPVAEILVKNGAEVNAATKAGYTPLHIASHYGQNNMVRFLLKNGANVKSTTSIGYTPLHQAAQQGHANIVNILLQNSAQPNAVTMNGQTPLHIAQKLGYITVIDTLKAVTEPSSTPTATEEKYRVVAPEAMHETFMSDSEEEGEDTVLGDQSYRYLTADEMKSLGDDSLPIDVTRDERIDSNRMVMSSDSNMYPPPHIEDTISPEHIQQNYMEYIKKYTPDNIDIDKHPLNIGFLVSFLVDARGGAMRGCRHSGVRVIVPPRCAASPTRVTCRYVRPQRTPHPPPLMEGEALASRILELGPVGAKFLGPVIIEVPHFAALRGKEREIVILRSDNGESWKEHTVDSSEDIMNEILQDTFEKEDLSQMEDVSSGRITRIVTQDFPQYFAVVSRVRQEVHAIGPEGGTVSSTVVPQVQATFPAGALTKKIKVGLQAQPIDPELVAKLLGHGVAVSPVVTIEPRRRKFHKAISLSMPAPRAHSQGMINQYSGSAPTLRLLCSITGGTSRAQWEDVTGSTPLSFVKDCVMFTTTVSARFWLMDCRNIGDATKMATELYREAIHVPFMAKFVVFAKRIDPLEARLRVFCMTDDKEDKTLEYQEQFTEVAKSRDVEVLEGKTQYIEFAGNLVPITKSGEQLQFAFRAFRENRLPFSVRVKDQHAEAVSRCLFMKEPKVQKGEPPQQPICILNIVLPDDIISETVSLTDSDSIKKYIFSTERFDYYRQDPRLTDISNLLGNDWVALANQLGLSTSEINVIKSEYPDSVAKQAQSMLRMWLSQSGNKTQTHILENGLKRIGREDIIKQCLEVEYKPHTYIRSRMDDIDKQDIEKDVIKHEKYIKEQVESKREIPDKYLAEEKEFEPSDEEDTFKKSVPERREQIEKRLSVERTIPASSQRVEIVQEISTIKRQSLVEDKIAEVQKATGEATKQPPKPVEKKETVQVKTTVKTAPAGKEPVVEERKVTKTIEKTVNERRDSDLLEGVTHILEATKKPIPVLIADEDPKSPKFSKTPPPSPADFISKEQAASVQQWDATAQSKLEPTEVKREEVVAQKGNLSSDLQQLSIDEEKYIHDNVSKIFPDKITKLKSILDQTNAFIKSESLPEPFDSTTNNIYVIRRHEERHDERTPEPKKKKKGILGTLKTFMSKSIDSETESEGSPKKLKKEKKTKSKDGATLETKPPKPRLPTPPETRKEYDNIPYIESSPSEAVKISSEPIEESFHYKKEKCDINTKIQVNGKMKPPKLKIEAKADEIQEFSQLKMTTDELIKSEIQHSSTLKIVKDLKNREEKLQTPSDIEAIVTEVPINMTETAKKPAIEIIQKSDTQLTETAPKLIQSEIKDLLKEKQSEKDIFKVDRKTILDTMVFLENEIENYGPSADTISLPEKLPRPERSPDAATVQKEETSQPKSRKTSSSSTQRAQQDIENSQSFLTMEVQNYYDHRTTPEKQSKKGNIIKKVGKKFGKLFGSKDSVEKPKSIDGDEKEALEEAFRQQEDVKNRTESPYSSRLSKASLSPKASLAVEEDVLREEDVEKVISLTQKSFEKSPSQEMKSTTEFLDKEKKLYEDSQYKISHSENDETLVVTTDKGKTSIEMVDSKMATEQLIANTNSFLNTEIEHYYDYKADTLSKEKKDNVIKKVGKSLTKEIGKIFGSKESLDKDKKSEGVTSPEKKVKGSPKLKKTKQRSKEEKLLSPEKKSDQKKEICSPEKLQKVIKEGLTSAAPIDETDRFIKTEKELYYSAPFSKPREVKESLSVKQPLVAKEPKKETDITKKQTETSEALPKAADFVFNIAKQMGDTKDFLALEIQHYYDYRASPDKKSKKDNVIKKVGKSISKEIGKMFKGKEKAVEEIPAKDDVTKEHVIEETSNFLNQEQASYVEEKPLAAEQEVMERKDLEPVESKPDKGKLNDGEILLKTDTDNFISQEKVQYDDGKYKMPRPIQDTVPKIGEPIIEGGVEKIIIPVDVIEDLQQKTEYELKPELRPSPEFLENLQMTDEFLRREILHYYDHRIGTPEKYAKKDNVIKKMGKTISKEFGKLFTGKEEKIKDKKLKRDSKEDSSLEDKVDLETCNAFLENEKKLYIPDEPKNALEVSKITSPKIEEVVVATKTETMHSMPKTQLLVETVKDAKSQMHDSTSDVLTEQVSHHLAPEPLTHVVLPQKVLEDIENTKNFLHDEIRHYYDFRTLVSEKQAKKPNIIKKVGKTISKEFGKLFVSKEEAEKPKVVQKKESISSLNNFYTEEDSPAVLEAETAKVFDMPSIPKEADEDAFRVQEAKEKELAQKKLEEETKASESKETESKEVLEQIKATDTFLSYELLFYDSDEKKSDFPVPPKSTVYSELIRAASADKDAQQIVKKDVVADTSVIQVHTKIEETIQGIDEGTKRTDVFSKIEITKRSTTSPVKIVQETVQERRDISDLIHLPGKKGIPSHVAENMRACEEFLNDEIVNYHDVKTIPLENVEVNKTHETRAAKDKEPQADKELQNEGKDKKKGTTIMKKVEKGLGKLFDVKDKKVIEDPAAEPVTEIVHTLESKPLESVKTGQLVEKSSEEIDKKVPKSDSILKKVGKIFESKDKHESTFLPPVRNPELEKNIKQCEQFLNGEVTNYHDVRPILPTSVEEIIQRQSDISKVESEAPAEKLKKEGKSDTIFQKFGKVFETKEKKEKKLAQPTEHMILCDNFLKTEVENYHDAKPVITVEAKKASSIPEKLTESEVEKINYKKDKKDSTALAKIGKMFGSKDKKDRGESPQRQHTLEGVKEDIRKSQEFLDKEIEHYDDATPVQSARTEKAGIVKRFTKMFGSRERSESPKRSEKEHDQEISKSTEDFLNLEIENYYDAKEFVTEKQKHQVQKTEDLVTQVEIVKEEGVLKKLIKIKSKEQEQSLESKEETPKHELKITSKVVVTEVNKYENDKPLLAEKTKTEQIDDDKKHETIEERPSEKPKQKEDESVLKKLGKMLSRDKKDVETPKLKRKQEEMKANQQVAKSTQEFLNGEIHNYYDVKPTVFKKILVKEIRDVSTSKPDKKPEETKLITTDVKATQDKERRHPSTEEFVNIEIEKYHDARPASTQITLSEIEQLNKDYPEAIDDKKEEKGMLQKLGKILDNDKQGLKDLQMKEKQELYEKESKEQMEQLRSTDDFLKKEVEHYYDAKPAIYEFVGKKVSESITQQVIPTDFPVLQTERQMERFEKLTEAPVDTSHVKPIEADVIQPKVSEIKHAKKPEERSVLKKLGKMLSKEKKEVENPKKQQKQVLDDAHQKQYQAAIEAADDFLKCEIDNYHDVKPTAFELISDVKAEKIPLKQAYIQPIASESAAAKDDKKEEKGVLRKLGKMLSKDKKDESPKQKKKQHIDDDHQKQTSDVAAATNDFLTCEIANYDDVKLVTTEGASAIKALITETELSPRGAKLEPIKDDKREGIFEKLGKLLGGKEKKEEETIRAQNELEYQVIETTHEDFETTRNFLVNEIDNYQDAPRTSVGQSPQKVETNENIDKKKDKDDGVLKKLGKMLTKEKKEETPKKKVQEDKDESNIKQPSKETIHLRNDFLTEEIKSYHDVKPKCFEPILADEQPIEIKDELAQISPQSKKKAKEHKDKVETKAKTEGILQKLGGIITGKARSESPKRKVFSEEAVILMRDSKNFLSQEIHNYDDVMPTKKQKPVEEFTLGETIEESLLTAVEQASKQSEKSVKKQIDQVESEIRQEGAAIEGHVDTKIDKVAESAVAHADFIEDEMKGGIIKKLGKMLGSQEKKESITLKSTPISEEEHQLIRNTNDFLNLEVESYEDVKPVKFDMVIDPTRTEHVDQKQKIKDDSLLNKIGMIFTGKDKRESVSPKRELVSDVVKLDMKSTDDFLKTEVYNYEDVKAQAKSAEAIYPEEEKEIKKLAKVVEEKEKPKEDGILKKLGKVLGGDRKEKSPKRKVVSDEVKQLLEDTNTFLNAEIEHYEDVKPTKYEPIIIESQEVKDKEESVLKRLSKVFTSTDKKPESPKSIRYNVSTNEAIRKSDEFLNIEKSAYYDTKPMSLETSKNVTDEAKQKTHKPHDKEGKEEGVLKRLSKVFTSTDQKGDIPKDLDQDVSKAEALKSSQEFLNTEKEKYEDALARSSPAKDHDKHEKDDGILKKTFGKLFSAKEKRETESPKCQEISDATKEEMKLSEEFLMVEIENYEDAKHISEIKIETRLKDEAVAPESLKTKFTKMFTSNDEKNAEDVQMDRQLREDIRKSQEFLNTELINYEDSKHKADVKSSQKSEKEGTLKKKFTKMFSKEKKDRESPQREAKEIDETVTKDIKETKEFLSCEVTNYHDTRPFTQKVVEIEKDQARPVVDAEKESADGILNKLGKMLGGKEQKRKDSPVKKPDGTEEDETRKITESFLNSEIKNYEDVRLLPVHTKEPDVQTKTIVAEVQSSSKPTETKDTQTIQEEQETGIIFRIKGKDVETPKTTKKQISATDELKSSKEFLTEVVKNYQDVKVKDDKEPDKAKKQETKDDTVLKKLGRLFESKDKREESPKRELAQDIKQTIDACHMFLEQEITHYENGKQIHFKETTMPTIKNKIEDDKKDEGKKDKTIFQKVGKIFESPKVKVKRDTKQLPTLSNEVKEAMSITGDFLTNEISNYQDVKILSKEPTEKVASSNDVKEAAKKVKDKPPKDKTVFKKVGKLFDSPKKKDKKTAEGSKTQSDSEDQVGSKDGTILKKVGKSIGKLFEDKDKKVESTKQAEAPKKDGGVEEAKAMCNEFLTTEIVNYHDVKPIVQRPKKKEKHSVVGSNNDPGVVITKEVKTTTEEKVFEDKIEEDGKVTDIKIDITRTVIDTVRTSEEVVTEEIINLRDEEIRISPIPRIKETGVEETHDFLDKEKSMYWDKEDKHRENKPVASPTLGHKKPKSDSSELTRTVSDNAGMLDKLHEGEAPEKHTISETNIDLSNLPRNAEEYIPSRQEVFTGKTSLAPSVASHRAHSLEEPVIVDLNVEQMGTITEPAEATFAIPVVDVANKSIKKPLFHLESSEDDDLLEGRRPTLPSVQSIVEHTEPKVEQARREFKKDVDIIEKKLSDLDKALGGLEKSIEFDVVEKSSEKVESKLRRIERKFERMASQALEDSAELQPHLTVSEVEKIQEREYQKLVSQLSLEEVNEFQKDYSTFWDEQTFSKSDDLGLKTPDTPADAQELPQDTGAVPKESSGFHHGRPEDQPGADSLHESTSEVDQKSPKPEPEKRDQ